LDASPGSGHEKDQRGVSGDSQRNYKNPKNVQKLQVNGKIRLNFFSSFLENEFPYMVIIMIVNDFLGLA
jgi:hypothetical protein